MESFIQFLINLPNNLIHHRFLESTFSTNNVSGLLILFTLAAITDIGVPVPFVLDTILLFTSYEVFIKHDPHFAPILLIVAMLFLGRQLGSGILYTISRLLGKVFINWLKCHFPSVGNGLDSFKTKLKSWGPVVVMTGRLTPGLLQATSVAAGAVRLNYPQFALGIALSSIVYDGILVLLGFIVANTPLSRDPNFTLWLLITLIVIVVVLWPVIFFMVRRNYKKQQPACDN
jgi:membrane protein DedA with SNARE-associated domain